jgi:hypothetical protein
MSKALSPNPDDPSWIRLRPKSCLSSGNDARLHMEARRSLIKISSRVTKPVSVLTATRDVGVAHSYFSGLVVCARDQRVT